MSGCSADSPVEMALLGRRSKPASGPFSVLREAYQPCRRRGPTPTPRINTGTIPCALHWKVAIISSVVRAARPYEAGNVQSFAPEEHPGEESAVPRDHEITKLDNPDEWGIRERGRQSRPPDPIEHEEGRATRTQDAALRRDDVHGSRAPGRQVVRHGRRGGFLVRDRIKPITEIVSLEPSDSATAESSAAIPEKPRLVGPRASCHQPFSRPR